LRAGHFEAGDIEQQRDLTVGQAWKNGAGSGGTVGDTMRAEYPARYRDRVGQELTAITNDGQVLSMTVRGILFQGSDFDSFEPAGEPDPVQLASFTLSRGELCSCIIEAEIPIPVVTPHGMVEGVLAICLELGDPAPHGGIDREYLTLKLILEGQVITSKGWSGWFEDELLDIQIQLPQDTYMKACINCAFSDYSPFGHGLFGDLACFRDNKIA
jgi:Family of unknown function (DUF6304)